MTEEGRAPPKGSLFRCFGEGIEPGQITSAWAVYHLDEDGKLVGVHHACLTETEAKATASLDLPEDGDFQVGPVTIIADKDYNAYILGPAVEVMSTVEVNEVVREEARSKLDPAALKLLGLE